MTDAAGVYRSLRRRLAARGLDAPNEANVLFETAVGRREYAFAPGERLTLPQLRALAALLRRRLAGEPLQYIAGAWPFLDFEVKVGPGALIPRDETEELASRAIAFLKTRTAPAALDLCSGTGCVALALARAVPAAAVTAVELSAAALPYLRENIAALCPRVRAVQADVFAYQDALAPRSLDLITCNPPYVTPQEYAANRAELAQEPRMAFLGGADGLDFYRHIIPAYKDSLKPGGLLLFETGASQTEVVAALLRAAGYAEVRVFADVFGAPRNVAGTKPGKKH